jgi:hypothetical protein
MLRRFAHQYTTTVAAIFFKLARDIFKKLAGYPPANAVTRPGRQYTNPFRLAASRAINAFQDPQCRQKMYPCDFDPHPTVTHPPDRRIHKWQK